VLKLFNNTQCISTGIFENGTTGIVLQAVIALPFSPENARLHVDQKSIHPSSVGDDGQEVR